MEDLAESLAESVLDPDERLAFLELCRPADAAELQALVPRVEVHLAGIRAYAERDPTVDLDLAARIGRALTSLVGSSDSLSFEERRLLAGAVEYFVLTGDRSDDLDDLLGLDDDARVAAAVCRALGREDLAAGI